MKVIGSDDWLVFAIDKAGQLRYTVIETDPVWLDAPHRGGFDEHFQPLEGYCDTEAEREDWRYVLSWIALHPADFTWHLAHYPLKQVPAEAAEISRLTKQNYGWEGPLG
jgi:hypothetical protein